MKIILVLILVAWINIETGQAKCPYSEKELRVEVKDCFRLGNKFIRQYNAYLDIKGSSRRRSRKRARMSLRSTKQQHEVDKSSKFDTCSSFAPFRQCITPLVDECPLLRQQLNQHWIPVLNHLTCVCSSAQVVGENPACKRETKCFESQSRGVLSRNCVHTNTFNRKQNTQDQCFFLRDMVECKYLLIKSSCGKQVADFGKHVEIISQFLKAKKCDLVKKPENYDGFEYSEKCPTDLSDRVDKCQYRFKRIDFYLSNSLIVDDNMKNLEKACGIYASYKRCVRPLRSRCPRGLDLLDQSDGTRRVYDLRMDFVCGQQKKLYSRHLYCYQEVVVKNQLNTCNHLWAKTTSLINNTLPFDYYCLKDKDNVKTIRSYVNQVIDCHSKVYADSCGDEAGDVIRELMALAFEEPKYMIMKRRPQSCARHLTKPARAHHQDTPTRTAATPPADWYDPITVSWPHRLRLTLHDSGTVDGEPKVTAAAEVVSNSSDSLCKPQLIIAMALITVSALSALL